MNQTYRSYPAAFGFTDDIAFYIWATFVSCGGLNHKGMTVLTSYDEHISTLKQT